MSGRELGQPTGTGATVHTIGTPDAAPEEADRNPGTALELDWIEDVHVNLSAVERRAKTLLTRRSVKKDWTFRRPISSCSTNRFRVQCGPSNGAGEPLVSGRVPSTFSSPTTPETPTCRKRQSARRRTCTA